MSDLANIHLLNTGNLSEAINVWKEAYHYIVLGEGWIELANNLGYAYFRAGSSDTPIKVLNEIIECDSTRALAYCNLGEVYEAKGDTSTAAANHKKYLQFESAGIRAKTIRTKLKL